MSDLPVGLERMRALPASWDHVIVAPVLCGLILGVAVLTDSASKPLDPRLLDAFGFRLSDLGQEPWRLLTCPFLIYRPSMLPSIVAIVALFVGGAELRLHWRWGLLSFVAGHLAGYILAPVGLLSLEALNLENWKGLTTVRDVGASNGAFGAWGALIATWPVRRGVPVIACTLVYLLVAIAVSAQIWDHGHLFAFVAGLGVGGTFLRRLGVSWPAVSGRGLSPRLLPELLGVGLAVLGGIHLIAALTLPRHPGFGRLEAWLPLGEPGWPRLMLALTGIAQLVLAPGLYRGQAVAWWLTVGALAITSVPTALAHPGPASIVLGLVLLLALLSLRQHFRAPSQWMRQPGGWIRAALPAAGGVLLLVLAGAVTRSGFQPALGPGSWLRIVAASAMGSSIPHDGSVSLPVTAMAREAIRLVPWVLWPLVFLSLVRLIQVAAAPRVQGRDRRAARVLLSQWGATGTAPMTLWKGNSLRLLRGGSAYCAYRVAYGHAVVLGEPVCPPAEMRPAVEEFADYALSQGWAPIYYAVSPPAAEVFRSMNWHLLQIGEEAIIPLAGLEFKGKAWQSTRSALNKAEREGIQFEVHRAGEIPPDRLAAIRKVTDSVSASHEGALPPMEFVLGDLSTILRGDAVVTVAVDAQGWVHAFASWLPVPARSGWVIDLMQRGDPSMSGAMEFLIARSFLHFKSQGVEMASLASAPLADLDRDPDRSLVQGLLGQVFERVRDPYDFRSLFEFKEKFQPHWEPVYLAYRSETELPTLGLALARAHMPTLDLVHLVAMVGRTAAHKLWESAEALKDAGAEDGAAETVAVTEKAGSADRSAAPGKAEGTENTAGTGIPPGRSR